MSPDGNRLRVAIVLPAYFESGLHFAGGGDRYPYRLAQALRAHCEVTLITFGPAALEEELDGLRHVVVRSTSSAPENPLPHLGFFVRERFDVVHVHQVRSAVTSLLTLLTRIIGSPLIATDHGGGGTSMLFPLRLYRLIRRFILVSDFSCSLLPPAARGRATVIHGGVDTDRFAFDDGPRERQVVQIGRIMPHKGIDYLIEAAGTDIPVVVAGRVYDQAYYEYLKQFSSGKPVRFLIDADDDAIRQLYRTSMITVAASVYRDHTGRQWRAPELLGLTLLESMAVGTPVICTRVGGMPEYVVDGRVGFIVPPNDPGELRSRMLMLLSDPRRAQAMGAAGRVYAESLNWKSVAAAVAREYARVRERGSRAR